MKLFSYFTEDRHVRLGLELDGKNYNFTQLWEFYKDIKGLHQAPQLMFAQLMVEMGFFNMSDINEVVNTVSELRKIEDICVPDPIEYDVPISRPQKILCIGRNYVKHAQETGHDPTEEPIFFAKMPSAMIPHEGSIIIPQNAGRVDHEIELGVVISQQGRFIPEDSAYEYVAGYTVVNDITAREMQKADLANQHPWLRSKNFDTFCPIGPFLVPHGAVPDPQNLNLSLKVNGEVRQQSNTSKMIFKIPELISYISRFMTLYPGDIIATGTPEGISPLKPGDVVEGEVEHIGKLMNYVTT